ncbi:hypothetical protein HYPSUDRAFT_33099 [Hypholoma sublateritium FD-334 SS-4]|uniref:DUF6697 domain-containing protein n=1 Tax=Hypholoma sublateritium (strain FD-334 SS-4) TaxID=945553 RepID=A0A0D2QAU6_HYPSF|nr:hypothetical protein HYPSUDRAFT_33099 [Hypholoma sublateritium FD-334 SS-4]
MSIPVKLESAGQNVIAGKCVFNVKEEFGDMRLEFNDDDDTKICAKPDPGLPCLPPKRPRLVFAGVVVPTLAAVKQRRAEEDKSDFKKLALLTNPKVKKNVGMALLSSTLRDRLKPIGLEIQDQYFTIDQATREVAVSRLFISTTYGGNMQQTFPNPARKFLDVHGMDDFMFLPTEYQPEAPLLPGAPGLWFCIDPGYVYDRFDKLRRVFVKVVPMVGSKASVYQFMGMYRLSPAVPAYLTVEEYAAQSAQFHNKWVEGMLEMGWGLTLAARVLLRRELGREPTPQEVENAENSRPTQCQEVLPDEIKAAFLHGEERMYIYTMKCVGYDNDFQRALSEQYYPGWKPPPKPPNQKKLPNSGNGATGMTKAGDRKPRARKRKLEETPESVPDIESELGNDMEYADLPVTRSQKRRREVMPEAA